MASAAERVRSGITNRRAVVATVAATATLLAGCGGGSQNKKNTTPVPLPTPTPTVAPAPKTIEHTPFDGFSYDTNRARDARISRVVRAFGLRVLSQSTDPSSSWAPFDAFCSPGTFVGSSAQGSEGYASQGYKPVKGQNCYVQHNPQYGGKPMSLGADVVVGNGGVYTHQFSAASVNGRECNADVTYMGRGLGWDVSMMIGKKVIDTDQQHTLAKAEAVDTRALACLQATQP